VAVHSCIGSVATCSSPARTSTGRNASWQAASDIYLGWTKGLDVRRYFYWRQLRDMKGSAVVEAMAPLGLTF
jgi:hypothetical protein